MDSTILTNDQIKEISETIEDTLKDSQNQEFMKQAKEEAAKDHVGEVGTATVVTNPFTGKPMYVEENDDDIQLQSFEEMMEDDSIIPMEIDESKIVIDKDKVKEQLETTFGHMNISAGDLNTIVELANRVKIKKSFHITQQCPSLLKI